MTKGKIALWTAGIVVFSPALAYCVGVFLGLGLAFLAYFFPGASDYIIANY